MQINFNKRKYLKPRAKGQHDQRNLWLINDENLIWIYKIVYQMKRAIPKTQLKWIPHQLCCQLCKLRQIKCKSVLTSTALLEGISIVKHGMQSSEERIRMKTRASRLILDTL